MFFFFCVCQGLRTLTHFPPATFVCLFVFSHTSAFQRFWTSRGHRCPPFFPPVLAFNFLSRIGCSNPTARRFFHRVLLTHSLAFFPQVNLCTTRKSPHEFIRVCMHSAGLELTKLTYNIYFEVSIIPGSRISLDTPPPGRPVFLCTWYESISPSKYQRCTNHSLLFFLRFLDSGALPKPNSEKNETATILPDEISHGVA